MYIASLASHCDSPAEGAGGEGRGAVEHMSIDCTGIEDAGDGLEGGGTCGGPSSLPERSAGTGTGVLQYFQWEVCGAVVESSLMFECLPYLPIHPSIYLSIYLSI